MAKKTITQQTVKWRHLNFLQRKKKKKKKKKEKRKKKKKKKRKKKKKKKKEKLQHCAVAVL